MIGYATLGTNNLPRALAFYDALLSEIGAKRLWDSPRGTAYGTSPTAPGLGIMTPFNGQPASAGNGTMLALSADSWAQVDAFYTQALLHGGKSEGMPGLRLQYGCDFYAAYVRDPDGNKLAVVCRGMTPQEPHHAAT
jgi:catechol 2,3-dioxygenase-like lactoylglutathione lyase family enzyme